MREIILLSLPSAFGRWLELRMLKALQDSTHSLRIIRVDRHDVVGDPEASFEGTLLYTANYPSRSLFARAKSLAIPVVVAVTSALDTVEDQCVVLNCSFLQALRAGTASAALMADFLALPETTLVCAPSGADPASAILARVAAAIAVPVAALSAQAPAGNDARLVDDPARPQSLDAAILTDLGEDRLSYTTRADLNERELTLIAHVLAPMVESMTSRVRKSISWPFDVFLSGDALDTPAGAVTDITGPARVLYYGPYCHLPNGDWILNVIVGFSEDISDMSFSMEVVAASVLAQGLLQPFRGGLFQTELPLRFRHAEEPIEIRFRSEAGAIEGRFALGRVEFTRME
jgi:hypothetical protein